MPPAASTIFDRLDRELWLVTACAGERRGGLIATFVSRASLVPELPRVTVGLAKHHHTWGLIEASGAFALHLIGEEQLEWVWRFGLQTGRACDKLDGLATRPGSTRAPILMDALACLDCRVEARLDTGDRTLYLAEVVDAQTMRDGAILTHKRLLERAPAEKLRALKESMARDINIDTEAILQWRGQRSLASQ
jgi:flavin reductase (DIM6/NTAB) family NADH-FMN oxidoreductase RutF